MIKKFRRRTVDVQAMQNDGTDDCAEVIAAWVRGHGGTSMPMLTGTVLEDPEHAFVFVANSRDQKIAAPGYWVVNTPDNKFYVVSNRDFRYLYEDLPDDVQGQEPVS